MDLSAFLTLLAILAVVYPVYALRLLTLPARGWLDSISAGAHVEAARREAKRLGVSYEEASMRLISARAAQDRARRAQAEATAQIAAVAREEAATPPAPLTLGALIAPKTRRSNPWARGAGAEPS